MADSSDSQHDPLTPGDLRLLRSLASGNTWLRAVLCTLARRGLALFEKDQPRAEAILDELTPYPFYKAGQFLFDLLEIEDFLLDGPLPEPVSTVLNPAALRNLTSTLHRLRAAFDEGIGNDTSGITIEPGAVVMDDSMLPEINASHYLYQYTVLGAVLSAVAAGDFAGMQSGGS